MTRRLVSSVAVAAAILAAAPVLAHSLLLESTPAAGAVGAAPTRVELRFNNRIEPRLSRIRIVGERGVAQDLAVLSTTSAPDRIAAVAPPLAAGQYKIEWQVLSTDGHVVAGRFSFRVAP